jgi:hypothetical protein
VRSRQSILVNEMPDSCIDIFKQLPKLIFLSGNLGLVYQMHIEGYAEALV